MKWCICAIHLGNPFLVRYVIFLHTYLFTYTTAVVFKLQIISSLLPALVGDDSDIILEVKAGVGGQEAMLFTKELFDMYVNYASYKGWLANVVNYDVTDIGKFFQFYFLHNYHKILHINTQF